MKITESSIAPGDSSSPSPPGPPSPAPAGRAPSEGARRGSKARASRKRSFGRVYQKPSSPFWYVRFPDPSGRRSPSGQKRSVVRAVATRKEAEALLAEVHRSLWAGTYAPPPTARAPRTAGTSSATEAARPTTVLDAVDEYIAAKRAEGKAVGTLKRYASNRTAIAASSLGPRLAAEVSPSDIEAYRAWRRERRWALRRVPGWRRGDPVVVEERAGACTNATVNRDLLLVSAAFNRLVRLRRLPENPAAHVPRGKEVRRPRVVLSKEEARALVGACSESLRPLVMAALYTGARLRELTRLTWGDVSFDNETISLFRPKVGNASRIPLHPALGDELRRVRDARGRAGALIDTALVFVSSRGNRWRTVERAWRNALQGAGLAGRAGLTFHSLRHCFAVHFLEGGAAVTDLQGLLGHASLATTQLYTRMVDSRARESLLALDFGTGRATPRRRRRGPGRPTRPG